MSVNDKEELNIVEVNVYDGSPSECGYERGRCFNDCIDGTAWISMEL